MSPDLARRIRDDNLALHNAPGYADLYDSRMGLISHPWEQRRFWSDLQRILNRLPPNPRALDLGAGTGNLTLKLLQLGASVTAVDSSQQMLNRLARNVQRLPPGRTHPARRLVTICADADALLASCSDSFHLVAAASFLHHLPDYAATLRLAAARVAPAGCLYCTHEPLPRSQQSLLARLLEWLDFKLDRVTTRLARLRPNPLHSGPLLDPDPFYNPASLADYWVDHGGIDVNIIKKSLPTREFQLRVRKYDSKRNRIIDSLSKSLHSLHLIQFEAWRR